MLCSGGFRLNLSLIFLLVSEVLSAQAQVGPAVTQSPQVPGLTPAVDLDLSLFYSDHMGLPGNEKVGNKTGDNLSTMHSFVTPGSRTIGLERARVGVRWENPRYTGVMLVLRPDYASLPQIENSGASGARTSGAREVDRRAGDVYAPAPTVKPLDAYSISMKNIENFEVEAGLFEELTPRRVSYYEVLEFGLNVAFPRKFSGARISWFWSGDAQKPGVQPVGSGVQLQLVALHGNDDRADEFKVGHMIA